MVSDVRLQSTALHRPLQRPIPTRFPRICLTHFRNNLPFHQLRRIKHSFLGRLPEPIFCLFVLRLQVPHITAQVHFTHDTSTLPTITGPTFTISNATAHSFPFAPPDLLVLSELIPCLSPCLLYRNDRRPFVPTPFLPPSLLYPVPLSYHSSHVLLQIFLLPSLRYDPRVFLFLSYPVYLLALAPLLAWLSLC
jgi:hypothetical protein